VLQVSDYSVCMSRRWHGGGTALCAVEGWVGGCCGGVENIASLDPLLTSLKLVHPLVSMKTSLLTKFLANLTNNPFTGASVSLHHAQIVNHHIKFS
jgi:hypothetical protein